MSDTVHIQRLKVWATIGVFDWEHNAPRPLFVDIDLETSFAAAARTEQLDAALDYGAVAEAVADVAASRPFTLLEALAEEVAARLLNDFKASAVSLRIDKPGAVANAESAGVSITRRKPERAG